MFSFIWSCAPILVSVTAFFTYVMQGNRLTVGTAFTVTVPHTSQSKHLTYFQAIALFGMIRAPLNVIPAWIVQLLQVLYIPLHFLLQSFDRFLRRAKSPWIVLRLT